MKQLFFALCLVIIGFFISGCDDNVLSRRPIITESNITIPQGHFDLQIELAPEKNNQRNFNVYVKNDLTNAIFNQASLGSTLRGTLKIHLLKEPLKGSTIIYAVQDYLREKNREDLTRFSIRAVHDLLSSDAHIFDAFEPLGKLIIFPIEGNIKVNGEKVLPYIKQTDRGWIWGTLWTGQFIPEGSGIVILSK